MRELPPRHHNQNGLDRADFSFDAAKSPS